VVEGTAQMKLDGIWRDLEPEDGRILTEAIPAASGGVSHRERTRRTRGALQPANMPTSLR